jgi:hypothetical protein
MAPVEDLVQDLVDLKVAQRSSRGRPRERVRNVELRMHRRVGPGVSKAVAARVLQVSVNTVDKWIARGRIPTVPSPTGRRLVALGPLVDLVAAVQDLREAGRSDGLLAAALLQLQLQLQQQQQDPHYREDFNALYGESLAAAQRGDLVPATIPDDFGPDD